ncbi:hypothetical protein DL96DRAFT_1666448 [Flagelloscypha sp. PMI_526]|nr:hypothetical protein DL96DRAFT_1666448 [Flagelloscypha sp. PMI_526]
MVSPYHIPAGTVMVVQQYIKELTMPIPDDMLSISLRQRHHFLSISFSDPESFLCWPDPSAEPSDLIHSIQSTDLDPEAPVFLGLRYSADVEHLYAHVALNHRVRLVFMWDPPSSEWKYHNAAPMPFPAAASHTSLDRALVHMQGVSPDVAVANQATPSSSSRPSSSEGMAPSFDISTHSDEEGGDDAYWNAYGDDESEDELGHSSRRQPSAGNDLSEDAYWAQYSSVQGTADSTIPSPVPLPPSKRRLLEPHSQEASTSSDYPIESHTDSPATALADRLANLAPFPDKSTTVFTEDSRVSSIGDFALSTLPRPETIVPPLQNGLFKADTAPPPADRAVQDSIRGIYTLWKATGGSTEEDFLRLVKLSLA